jgi:endonuclease/exonuclease/phosphatase family metal-dependent hydrolase
MISKKVTHLFFLVIMLLTILGTTCQNARNYLSPEGPKFTGNYADHPGVFNDSLKVVTFNIKFAREVDQAIKTLRDSTALSGADIILLQEMDETGTEKIAKSLHYDYVYFPATVHPQTGRNFGNAILSRWPLQDVRKIILPYEFFLNKTRRIAVAASLKIDDINLRVYSVHTATVVLSEEKRMAQADSIIRSVSKSRPYIIVGGDFNTMFEKNVKDLDRIFRANGFIRASRGAGATLETGPVEFTMDHIYTKGFAALAEGVVETGASDHQAEWVMIAITPETDQYKTVTLPEAVPYTVEMR